MTYCVLSFLDMNLFLKLQPPYQTSYNARSFDYIYSHAYMYIASNIHVHVFVQSVFGMERNGNGGHGIRRIL